MVIELSDVSVRVGGRWVLAHLGLAVPAGRTVLLAGANGAGKTTLLRLIATAIRPTRGEVRLFGLDAAASRERGRARLGLMTHAHHFYEPLSARQNMALVARLTGRRPEAASDLLVQVGLGAHAERPMAGFSAGMKRRLALARLLLLQPELVLLDEPFGQLDPDGVALMEASIRAMQRAGTTVMMATHDLARGHALADEAWQIVGRALRPLSPAPTGSPA